MKLVLSAFILIAFQFAGHVASSTIGQTNSIEEVIERATNLTQKIPIRIDDFTGKKGRPKTKKIAGKKGLSPEQLTDFREDVLHTHNVYRQIYSLDPIMLDNKMSAVACILARVASQYGASEAIGEPFNTTYVKEMNSISGKSLSTAVIFKEFPNQHMEGSALVHYLFKQGHKRLSCLKKDDRLKDSLGFYHRVQPLVQMMRGNTARMGVCKDEKDATGMTAVLLYDNGRRQKKEQFENGLKSVQNLIPANPLTLPSSVAEVNDDGEHIDSAAAGTYLQDELLLLKDEQENVDVEQNRAKRQVHSAEDQIKHRLLRVNHIDRRNKELSRGNTDEVNELAAITRNDVGNKKTFVDRMDINNNNNSNTEEINGSLNNPNIGEDPVESANATKSYRSSAKKMNDKMKSTTDGKTNIGQNGGVAYTTLTTVATASMRRENRTEQETNGDDDGPRIGIGRLIRDPETYRRAMNVLSDGGNHNKHHRTAPSGVINDDIYNELFMPMMAAKVDDKSDSKNVKKNGQQLVPIITNDTLKIPSGNGSSDFIEISLKDVFVFKISYPTGANFTCDKLKVEKVDLTKLNPSDVACVLRDKAFNDILEKYSQERKALVPLNGSSSSSSLASLSSVSNAENLTEFVYDKFNDYLNTLLTLNNDNNDVSNSTTTEVDRMLRKLMIYQMLAKRNDTLIDNNENNANNININNNNNNI